MNVKATAAGNKKSLLCIIWAVFDFVSPHVHYLPRPGDRSLCTVSAPLHALLFYEEMIGKYTHEPGNKEGNLAQAGISTWDEHHSRYANPH
mmetsp:Transcript_20449/g.28534  ORF Transcript_20449/g.28534 Transcript_20449/m.28534 type:complete len:91 (-) Transcript_20449:107-379(-)